MIKMPLPKGYFALIDDEDADLLSRHYSISVRGDRVYSMRKKRASEGRGTSYLHRDIAERTYGPIPKGYDVDHINHNTLDCRRANLRVVLHRVNLWHQNGARRHSVSGVRGVRPRGNLWQAYICTDHAMRSLGYFKTIEGARAARLAAEAERLESIAA